MASRISHRSARRRRSFSRLMVRRAIGTAMVDRTSRMAVAIISSRSVNPQSGLEPCPWRIRLTFMIDSSQNRSLNGYRRLRAIDRNSLQTWVAGSAAGDGQRSLSRGLGLKCYRDHGTLTRNAASPWRTRSGDLQCSGGFIFAMDKSYDLPVLREESPIRDVYELQLCGIVVQLDGYGIYVLRAGD